MYASDELLPISALQHLLYCERQAALIHVERLWAENRLTVEGRQLHKNAHDGADTTRDGVRTTRALELVSRRLGIFGIADIVEFHAPEEDAAERTSRPVAFPIEYKRGRPKKHDADRVQLCAQALCLEQMLDVDVPTGAIYYGSTRRREQVIFDSPLRDRTERAALRLHELIRTGTTPPAQYEREKCERCSLKNLCLPHSPRARGTRRYLDTAVAAGLSEAGDAP